MKPSSAITIIVASVAPVTNAAFCTSSYLGSHINYFISAEKNIGNAKEVCGNLWDKLRRFGSCTVTAPHCGNHEDFENDLIWDFNVPIGCNGGMVESAWWEATQNSFGGIDC